MNTLQANDVLVARDRVSRAVFFGIVTTLILILPYAILRIVGAKFGFPALGWLLGFPLSVALFLLALPLLHFRISGNKYLLATGWNGDNIPFGPGFLRLRFPWDKARADGNYTADIISVEVSEKVACSDGPSVDVKYVLGYQINPAHIDTYDAVDKASIGRFISTKAKAWLSAHYVTLTNENALRDVTVSEEEARRFFQETIAQELQRKFGIRVPVVSAESVDRSAEAQKARDAADETKAILEAVGAALVGDQEENGLRGYALAAQRLAEGKISQATFNATLNTARGQAGDIKFEVRDFNINGLGDLSPEAAAALAAAFATYQGKTK